MTCTKEIKAGGSQVSDQPEQDSKKPSHTQKEKETDKNS
jgi:hypothetical protein